MEKFIIINNCTKDELKTILKDWLVSYVERLKSKLVFEFAEIKPNRFILKIDKSIGDTLFFYLVNYLAFPTDFKKTFEVTGYAIASEHKAIQNKKIYVFINQQDEKYYDNVWITTEYNETYKFDMGGKFTKVSESNFPYIKPNIDDSSVSYEQIIFKAKELWEEVEKIEKAEAERNLAVRFKIISTLLFIGIPIAFLIKQITDYFTDFELLTFFMMAMSVWFILDYKVFYNRKRILVCVLLSLFVAFFDVTAVVFPISSIIVVLLANKLLGTKRDYLENKWYLFNRWFWLILLVLSALISMFVFGPILKYLMNF